VVGGLGSRLSVLEAWAGLGERPRGLGWTGGASSRPGLDWGGECECGPPLNFVASHFPSSSRRPIRIPARRAPRATSDPLSRALRVCARAPRQPSQNPSLLGRVCVFAKGKASFKMASNDRGAVSDLPAITTSSLFARKRLPADAFTKYDKEGKGKVSFFRPSKKSGKSQHASATLGRGARAALGPGPRAPLRMRSCVVLASRLAGDGAHRPWAGGARARPREGAVLLGELYHAFRSTAGSESAPLCAAAGAPPAAARR
jgi:hypothetical protein